VIFLFPLCYGVLFNIHPSEVLSGTRSHAASSLVGRLRYDISLRRIDPSVHRSIHLVQKLKEIHNILSMNRLRRTRLYEIGITERDFRSPSGLSMVEKFDHWIRLVEKND
jgi:NADH:ubiquinone oxidoreductase subunit D